MNKLLTILIVAVALVVMVACGTPAPAPTTLGQATQPPTQAAQATPMPATATPKAAIPSATAATQATSTPIATATAVVAASPVAATVVVQLTGYPAAPTGIPAGVLPAAQPAGDYVAFAWNNLGMHCYQTDYSQFLILPPYNVFWTQVIARSGGGREDPSIVSGGLTVSYSMPQVTKPADHTNFWQYAAAYGWTLQPGIGLTGKGTSGTLDPVTDHYIAEGVPVVDVNDSGIWDPYPFFIVDVKKGDQTVAQTFNVAPASTEMSCYLCHTGSTLPEVFAGILQTHDRNQGTSLAQQAQQGKPVMCDSCHADPAMGVMESKVSKLTLSGAVHTFHADKLTGSQLPQNTCQACHPGPQTQCLRDVMAKAGITCTDCHGTMQDVGASTRTPWVTLPTCQGCHGQNLGRPTTRQVANPNQALTANSDALYRNSKAHGGGGIYCAACHGSPHAIYPTLTERDNQQSVRLQGRAGTIAECTVCHTEQPDERFWHIGRGD
jgi:hypothetical protein